jgi:hypothetical protein
MDRHGHGNWAHAATIESSGPATLVSAGTLPKARSVKGVRERTIEFSKCYVVPLFVRM